MRALLQRVTHAQVEVDGKVVGSCESGYLILLGISTTDTEAEARKLWAKILGLRVFDDDAGKMNLSLKSVDGEVLVVSQFTLYANSRRGMRPAFVDAARPETAVPLYELFCQLAEEDVRHVGRGVFGANMQVSLVNDGPVTIWLDTDELSAPGRHH